MILNIWKKLHSTVILTNGFRKKTDKTPRDVIELAKKYRDDFIERYGKEGI
jgi:phage-related protein